MAGRRRGEDACFGIGAAAKLVNVHPQTLRYYERAGLLKPARSEGRIRLYSAADLQQALQIKRLIDDLGVNLAGVEVILQLTARLRSMEQELDELRREHEEALRQLRRMLARTED